MMCARGLILALGVLVAIPGWAEGKVGTLVAAGPNRILLDAWPENGWSVKSFENLVEVRFPRSGLDLVAAAGLADSLGPEISAVEVEARDGDAFLRLTLTCDCRVSMTGNGLDRTELAVLRTASRNAARSSTGPDPAWAPIPKMKPAADADGMSSSVSSDDALDVDEARARLMEQLLKAAEAGIVSMRPEHDASLPDMVDEPRLPEVADQDNGAIVGLGGADDPNNTRENEAVSLSDSSAPLYQDAGEAADQPIAATDSGSAGAMGADHVGGPEHTASAAPDAGVAPVPDIATAPPEPTCFDTSAFAFPEIEGSSDFLEALSGLRGKLVGEFDTPEEEVALELARTYLAAGMAVEAAAVATDFAPQTAASDLLQEISAVVDRKPLPSHASLLKEDCEGDQAVWRAAALATDPAHAEAALEAELMSGRSLERMPVDLREMVAARIGNAAVSIGDWDTARRMEAMAVRAVGGRKSPRGETLLLAARLADWNGEEDRAWDFRQRARKTGPPHSDTALIEIAEAVLRSETYLGSKTTSLQIKLGDLARRERGTDLGAKAFELEARLHAREHGRDEVVDLLADAGRAGLLPEDKQAALLSELIEDTPLDELSRPVGLIYLEDPGKFADAMGQAGFRRAVARSLTELGLPALAEPLLLPEDHSDTKLMAGVSEAFLATGDARQALDIAQLISPGEARDGAMAAALAALGQAERSAPLLSALERSDGQSMTPQHAALERAVDAGVASGDLAAARTAAAKLLEMDPTQRRAEELVMLALMDNAPEIPSEAKSLLDEVAPGRSAALEVLFTPTASAEGLKDHAEATDLLERMETEVQLLEGLLNNG